jgi:quercetin dioxygenase-like cupin family protein
LHFAWHQKGAVMSKIIKNIEHGVVLPLAGQVGYLDGQIVSKTLSQNDCHSLTLFAFEKGEEISTHASEGDAFVLALDGTGRITIDGDVFMLNAGEAIVMPANAPHAVYAETRFKMMLNVLFT